MPFSREQQQAVSTAYHVSKQYPIEEYSFESTIAICKRSELTCQLSGRVDGRRVWRVRLQQVSRFWTACGSCGGSGCLLVLRWCFGGLSVGVCRLGRCFGQGPGQVPLPAARGALKTNKQTFKVWQPQRKIICDNHVETDRGLCGAVGVACFIRCVVQDQGSPTKQLLVVACI